MKKFFLMLLILFTCGLFSADLCMANIQNENILMSLERFTEYAYNETQFKAVFWSVLYERGKLFALLILIMLTPLRDKLSALLASIVSFVWGFFCMSCIETLGMVGVVVAITSVIPHGLLYLAVFLLLMQRRQARRYIERNRLGRSVVSYAFILLLFITGCVLETVIGAKFVPWIIRLSLV